ncbi:MAG: 50S ribosomal protein L18, partial [Candidatus Caldarchaeum sp.]|nr:50S ribosomal protein L18 [Candidatus Caldarchaeum sp.]
LLTVSSDVLSKYGWKASFKSVPAAYLTGLLAGKKAVENGIKEAIVDLGLYRSVKGSRLYAVVKGAAEAGLEIPFNEEVMPDEDRLYGKHIVDYVGKISQTPVGWQFAATDRDYLLKLEDEVKRIKGEIVGGGGDG